MWLSVCATIKLGINVLGAKAKRRICKYFISLAFHKGGRFFGLFRSYGRPTKSTVHRISSLVIFFNAIYPAKLFKRSAVNNHE